MLGHQLVYRVAKCFWQHPSHSRELPDSIQLRQQVKHRIRAKQERFIGLPVVSHDIDSVEVVRIQIVALQQAVRKFALQRGKSKTIVRITFEKKLDEMITESANAVVKNDWVGFGFRQSVRSNPGHTERTVT